MFYNCIIKLRQHLKEINFDVNAQWAEIYDYVSSSLYRFYINPNHNHFWTLTDPQEIGRCRLYNKTNGALYITIEDVSNAFAQACSATDLQNTTDEKFLSVFDSYLSSNIKLALPEPSPFEYNL